MLVFCYNKDTLAVDISEKKVKVHLVPLSLYSLAEAGNNGVTQTLFHTITMMSGVNVEVTQVS